jgi:hypothetical protein
MKNKLLKYAQIAACSLLLASCGPPRTERFVEIEPNETAFVIALEDDSNNQKQFESIEYLEKQKVASKRIPIPLREKKTGRMWFDYEWIPLVRVVSIDRAPVTRQWTGADQTQAGAAIAVESRDSIGFTVGINLTAYVDEGDTAKFLYYYRSKQLNEIIDQNIRGYIQMKLSEEFGARDLQACKTDKNDIMNKIRPQATEHFEQYGVTITALGMSEGLQFEESQIQAAINNAYIAEMEITREKQRALAQEQINARMLAEAAGQRAAAEEFAKAADAQRKKIELEIERMRAEAYLESVKKWNGNVPYFWTGSGEQTSNPFLFQMPSLKTSN